MVHLSLIAGHLYRAEECEKHPIDSLEGYREVVSMMATEQIIQEWAQAKGITQREDVQHDISDLFDHANVEEVVNRISEQQLSLDSISKLDIRVCQVKCVSSLLNLFTQFSAIEGADRNSGHGGDLFVRIGL